MNGKTLYIDSDAVDNAVTLWRMGQLVVVPTETVYGLAADALNGEAVARIYNVKGRPQFNPLIVHVADEDTAQRYVEWTNHAETLARAFWPGPLTLVLRRRRDCPISELVSAGGDTLGIRIPAHPVTLQLLKAFDGPIAAPSANRSGCISPTTAQHARDELGDAAPLIIDGGACQVGIESTVIDLTGDAPVMLRPGAITKDRIADLGIKHWRAHAKDDVLKSPGQLESHYAPSAPVRLNATQVMPDEALLAFGTQVPLGAATTLNLSERGDLIEAAANLFSYLRSLDHSHHRTIAVMPIPETGLGVAINDRLRRAAAPR